MFRLQAVSEDDTIYLFGIFVRLRMYMKPFGAGNTGRFFIINLWLQLFH